MRMKDQKEQKAEKAPKVAGNRIVIPLEFEETVADLLQVKPVDRGALREGKTATPKEKRKPRK